MRRNINLMLATGLILAGVIGSISVLFFSATIPFPLAVSSELSLGLGLIWLYSDLTEVRADDQEL
jgi:hypothetical protein